MVDGAYPPTDTAVHKLLMEWASEYSGLALQSRFHGFLQVVFEEITKELRGMLASRSGDTKLPLEWHKYLTAHRGMLYSRVAALAVGSLRHLTIGHPLNACSPESEGWLYQC